MIVTVLGLNLFNYVQTLQHQLQLYFTKTVDLSSVTKTVESHLSLLSMIQLVHSKKCNGKGAADVAFNASLAKVPFTPIHIIHCRKQ
ncbi:CLUMA_CG002836, isoform A [Clunio marinus]|uniref:CLUMA_CG002836, isoform A n=1 Tax=Clunio marinus TaxID=568069 RepID=A0A1J1HNB3_9DIPT|nr:CLUMA_CG002836, isoform A [Clunio marinus]